MSELYPILRALKMGEGSGGGGGTSDYTQLSNKPQINSHTLTGNMSSSDLGLQSDVMTGYEEPSATGAIAETDTVLEAMGKLEKKADNNQTNISLLAAHFSFTENSGHYYLQPEQPSNPSDGDIWIG